MEQKIEGSELSLDINIKGGKANIFADKVIYSGKELIFFNNEVETLKIILNKEYKTIYGAFKYSGINVKGY